MKKALSVMLLAIACVSNTSFVYAAQSGVQVIEYLYDSLEVRFDGTDDYQLMELAQLPEPPVKVLKVVGQNLQIELAEEKRIWIERDEVTIDKEPEVVSICQTSVVGMSSDGREYGLRGAGAGCKK